MSFLCLFVALCFATNTAVHSHWTGLTATFSADPNGGYYDLPRTRAAALSEGWTAPTEQEDGGLESVLCYGADPTLCVLYDSAGLVCGTQVGISVEDVAGVPFNYDDVDLLRRTTRFGREVYLVTVFIVPEAVPESGGEDAGTGLWVQGGAGLLAIPMAQSEIALDPTFTHQPCLDGMGEHYINNSTRQHQCDLFFIFYALYNNSQLIGFEVEALGTPTAAAGGRAWFEAITEQGLRELAPWEPECFLEMVGKYNVISLHVWFVEGARHITCTTNSNPE